MTRKIGIEPSRIDGWFSAWDHAALGATILRSVMEEAPASLSLLRQTQLPIFDLLDFKEAAGAAHELGRRLGAATPIIAMPHHDNHAWFSYCASPFARDERPVMVAVIDGAGDRRLGLALCLRARPHAAALLQ